MIALVKAWWRRKHAPQTEVRQDVVITLDGKEIARAVYEYQRPAAPPTEVRQEVVITPALAQEDVDRLARTLYEEMQRRGRGGWL